MQIDNSIAIDIYDNEQLIAHYDSQQQFVDDYKKMLSEINFLRKRENKLQLIEQMFKTGIIDLNQLTKIIKYTNSNFESLNLRKNDYSKYYQKGGNYLIPVEILDDLLEQNESLMKRDNALQNLEIWLEIQSFDTSIGVFTSSAYQKVLDKIKELEGSD